MIEHQLDLTTPALLFPAISLLLLAYTNRFLTLAQLLRQVRRQSIDFSHFSGAQQVKNLRFRVLLIRWMQFLGVAAFLLCTATMLALYLSAATVASLLFLGSLITLCGSLIFSMWEIHISMVAINLELEGLERESAEGSEGQG